MSTSIYKRILLKISGQALVGPNDNFGLDPHIVQRIAGEVIEIMNQGVQVGVVIGGGNFFRGEALSKIGIDRVSADQMGMLSTVINAIALRDALEQQKQPTRIMSAIPMSGVVDHYDRRKAVHHLEQKRVVLFAGGTGNPLVTTDSAASLRAIEIGADVLLKATQVDGIYDAHPGEVLNATLYKHLTYAEALDKELGVMDLAAFCQCRDHKMPIRVFNLGKEGAMVRVVQTEAEGTLVNGG